jgi:methylated-DNA-protein-cysteine methyltransferase-like protein
MAPRSEDAAAWFATVYRAIQEIPEGKVTTYSRVARLVGYRKLSKQAFLDFRIDSELQNS